MEEWAKIIVAALTCAGAVGAVIRYIIKAETKELLRNMEAVFNERLGKGNERFHKMEERLSAVEDRSTGVLESVCVERRAMAQREGAALVKIAILNHRVAEHKVVVTREPEED